MKQKWTDFAAGRLGAPGKKKGHAEKTNYGVDRLGITSDAAEPKKPESPLKPFTFNFETTSIKPKQQETPKQVFNFVQPESIVRRKQALPTTQTTLIKLINDKKDMLIKRFGYFGVGAGALVLVLVLWLAFRGNDAKPKPAAAASRHPNAVVVETTSGNTEPSVIISEPSVLPEKDLAISGPVDNDEEDSDLDEEEDTASEPEPGKPATAVKTPKVPTIEQNGAPEQIVYTAPPANLRLHAVIKGGNGPVAIINNKFFREGQRYGPLRVIKIGDTSVDLEIDGKRCMLGVAMSAAPSPGSDFDSFLDDGSEMEDPDEDADDSEEGESDEEAEE